MAIPLLNCDMGESSVTGRLAWTLRSCPTLTVPTLPAATTPQTPM